ncbi:MAG: AraC family transcriptional regulator [Treponema sp.]|nr:AraC family transcriptional regulator [Treponema sp.]
MLEKQVATDIGKKESLRPPEHFACSFNQYVHKPFYYHPHWHDFMELVLVKKGIKLAALGNVKKEINEGELLVIPPGELHSFENNGKDILEFICLTFHTNILLNDIFVTDESGVIYSKFLNAQHKKSYVCGSQEVKKAGILPLMNNILHELSHKEPGYTFAIKADLSKIFLWLLRRQSHDNSSTFDAENKAFHYKMTKVFEIIQSQYKTNISTEKIADMLAMSKSHFCYLFKRHTGHSFRKYLQSLRIQESTKMLLSTNKNINEIAFMVGYDDVNFFISSFKQQIGMPPLKYKKHYLSSHRPESAGS